jgi:hypothetical protein
MQKFKRLRGKPASAWQWLDGVKQRQPTLFAQLIKWRTGSEGRISYLKHSWGWERTRVW